MPNIEQEKSSSGLAQWVIAGMQEKKGQGIVRMDMRSIHNSIVDYFVICHANSSTQADALAESVMEVVKKNTGLNPKSIEGKQIGEWILIDYFDVVAHIFLGQVRSFYRLEELWADADIKTIDEP